MAKEVQQNNFLKTSCKNSAFQVFSSTICTTSNLGSIMKHIMICATLLLSIISHAMEPEKIQLNRGFLIAIEGIDGSGKSTLAHHLHTALEQKYSHVELTKEPGGTELGKKIREMLQTQPTPVCSIAESLLFAADRAQHFFEMEQLLQQNCLIISDRLADSSLAYQGYGRGLDQTWIKDNNKKAMNGRQPDLTIFVKVPVKTALERIQKRNETQSVFEKEPFLQKVADGFEDIYSQYMDNEDFKRNYCTNARELYIKSLEGSPRKLTPLTKKFNLII